MTAERTYREPFTVAAALGELRRHAGTQFDPRVVRVFCDVVSEHAAAASPVSSEQRVPA